MIKGLLGFVIGVAGIIFFSWWIYDMVQRQDRIDAIYEEGDRQLEVLHQKELRDCAASPYYRETWPESCVGWEKYANE